jgi:hypothetical protein
MVNRSKVADPLVLARLLAGLDRIHEFPGLMLNDALPPEQRLALIRATATVARIMTDWAANRYGNSPEEHEVYSLRGLAQWLAGGQVGGAFYARCASMTPGSLECWRKPFHTESVLDQIPSFCFGVCGNGEQGCPSTYHFSSRTGRRGIGDRDVVGSDPAVSITRRHA